MAPEFDPRPVTLSGEHVRLEPLAPHHAEQLFDAGSDSRLWHYMPVPPPTSVEDIAGWIEQATVAMASGSEVAFAVVETAAGRAVGSTRFLDIRRPDRGLEIGWTWIEPAVQRSVVNTESKLLLLTHAFDDLGAFRVQFKTDGRNAASQRAIERLGAVREGVLRRNRLCWDGHLRDTVYYSIIDAEWPLIRRRLLSFLGRTEYGQPNGLSSSETLRR
jgi:N-acetyltransferase